MKQLLLAFVFAASLAPVGSTTAQVYPTRPITMIVPFPAGGSVDAVGRIVAEGMRVSLGQTVVVENVAGAAGSIGVGRVARAAADGYTLSMGQWGTHVANGAIYALPYDVLRDFEPLALLASNPYLVLTKNTVPANDLKDFVAWLKANPNKALLGTPGWVARLTSAEYFFRTQSGPVFSSCPTAAVLRRCAIYWPARST